MAEIQANTDTDTPTVTIDGVTLTYITIEYQGDNVYTVDQFWDCSCAKMRDYIHVVKPEGGNRCAKCGVDYDNAVDGAPNSRLDEVIRTHADIYSIPWFVREQSSIVRTTERFKAKYMGDYYFAEMGKSGEQR